MLKVSIRKPSDHDMIVTLSKNGIVENRRHFLNHNPANVTKAVKQFVNA